MKCRFIHHACVVLIGLAGITSANAQEPLPFRRAIELALARSNQIALSHADEVRGYQTYLESRNSRIPKVAVGSDIGYAHGFPLSLEGSAPTLFSVTTQSSVWNAAERDVTRSAKLDWSASKSQGSDQRAQVIMDAASAYIELNMWESRLSILRAELKVGESIENAEAERVNEGIDKGIERTKAELIEAEVKLHIAEGEGGVDILRLRLSQMTGLDVRDIRTDRESIPVVRDDGSQNGSASLALESNPAVESAAQSAAAKQLRARAEHRAFYPSADFAAQYGLVNTSLTNFEQFFVPHSFQPNNVTFGLVLRFPFLDRSQHARAAAADAEALRARKEVEEVKNKAVMDVIRTQHNVQQVLAAQRVADLRYRLAENDLEAAHARMESETATLRELQNAAVQASERSLERINADFEVQRAELGLLRAKSGLESWVFQ